MLSSAGDFNLLAEIYINWSTGIAIIIHACMSMCKSTQFKLLFSALIDLSSHAKFPACTRMKKSHYLKRGIEKSHQTNM